MLFPGSEKEERFNMEIFYKKSFCINFCHGCSKHFYFDTVQFVFSTCYPVNADTTVVFFIVMIYASIKNIRIKIFHKALAVAIISGDMLSVILSENSWIIK